MMLRIEVKGVPKSQGSMRAFAWKAKDGREGTAITSSNKGLAAWRRAVSDAVQTQVKAPLLGPIWARLEFRLPMPKGARKRCRACGRALYIASDPVGNVGWVHRGKARPGELVHQANIDALPAKHGDDIDKLVRAVFDSITHVAIEDDGYVVEVTASKRYADPWETPGVSIGLSDMSEIPTGIGMSGAFPAWRRGYTKEVADANGGGTAPA